MTHDPDLSTAPEPVRRWHSLVESGDPAGLVDFLAEDAVFRSPAVHEPQEGRELVTTYLSAAFVVLGPTLSYRRQWWTDDSAVLEFEAEVGGRQVHGVDMIRWREDGRVVDFTVMIRPIRGLESVIQAMAEQLFA